MRHWLQNDATIMDEELLYETEPESAEDLACLSSLPNNAINYHIHDRFIPVARLTKTTSLVEWQSRCIELKRELQAKVFRWFPSDPIPFETVVSPHSGGWAATYTDYKDVVFQSEAGMPIRAQLLSPGNASAETPWLIYVKRAGDSIYPLDLDELLPVLGRYTVLILNPRLTEDPVSASEYAELERTASWIGRTVAGMQIWDILRALAWIREEATAAPLSLALYGKGEMGILTLYAGIWDPMVQQVILESPPVSHRQAPALLNILRITDIPEAAGLYAPRRLTFLREVPSAFDLTREIYQLHDRPNQLDLAASLPEALEIWRYSRK